MVPLVTLAVSVVVSSGPTTLDDTAAAAPTCCIRVILSGSETIGVRPLCKDDVLDAIAVIPGLSQHQYCANIFVIRGGEILNVKWQAIVRNGETRTNYKLRAGDILVYEVP
jgi:hypothetical protein